MSWDKPNAGDRFSIAISKYAGGDPGPNADTTALTYTFNKVYPGKWYVNIKTGNSERWGDINYWTVDLPSIEPDLTASISNIGNQQYLNYSYSCIKTVEAPKELITQVNKSAGSVLLNYNEPTSITLTGYDFNGKKHEQQLSFKPLPTPTIAATKNTDSSTSSDSSGWLWLPVLGGGYWLYRKIKKPKTTNKA